MAIKAALIPSHTDVNIKFTSQVLHIQLKKIRSGSQCKHALFKISPMPFSCHRFAKVGTRIFLQCAYLVTAESSVRRMKLCPQPHHVYRSTNAFNTVLNIQERKNVPTGQNKCHKFLKMPQIWHHITKNL